MTDDRRHIDHPIDDLVLLRQPTVDCNVGIEL